MHNRSTEFFDAQFQRQVQEGDFKLNAFEARALDHIRGTVLDLGCGLGNLSLAAARRGHHVTAWDASPTGIAHIERVARAERLPLTASVVDAQSCVIDRNYTTIVSIGLLMFLPRARALELLCSIQARVEPGGVAIVNVLTVGTTFMSMFEPGGFCLFDVDELAESFRDWGILSSVHEGTSAPHDTRKEFSTVIAEKARA